MAGGPLVVLTDARAGPGKPHDVMAYAVIQFGGATGDPVGALRLATSQAADAVGLGDTCGRLAPGRAADLLVVCGHAVPTSVPYWSSKPSTGTASTSPAPPAAPARHADTLP